MRDGYWYLMEVAGPKMPISPGFATWEEIREYCFRIDPCWQDRYVAYRHQEEYPGGSYASPHHIYDGPGFFFNGEKYVVQKFETTYRSFLGTEHIYHYTTRHLVGLVLKAGFTIRIINTKTGERIKFPQAKPEKLSWQKLGF